VRPPRQRRIGIMSPLSPNAVFIGAPQARADLNTPFLALDAAALRYNIAAMAGFARSRGMALRPHAKTHKSLDIARLQLEAGAVGICCAKLGEAEIFAAGGVTSILITSPVVGAGAIARLMTLAAQNIDLRIVVDSIGNVQAIGREAARHGITLGILIDIDPGFHRTGVVDGAQALQVAEAVCSFPGLKLAGVQFYCGTQQHIQDYAERLAVMKGLTARLVSVLETLRNAGHKVPIVSGGGTGTHEIDAGLGVLTELQAGSYTVMDDQYDDCVLRANGDKPFRNALSVEARVVSANLAGLATVDAGLKAFATEGAPPRVLEHPYEAATFVFRGDEHGHIVLPAGSNGLTVGAMVRLSIPHCDPTINLYDAFHVMEDGQLVDLWPVSARGRSA
jgi:3-hydroxy-D-aspartate aldolase